MTMESGQAVTNVRNRPVVYVDSPYAQGWAHVVGANETVLKVQPFGYDVYWYVSREHCTRH